MSRTVYHPTLTRVTRDVPEGDVKAWRAAGWRLTPPTKTAAAETAADEASNDMEGASHGE